MRTSLINTLVLLVFLTGCAPSPSAAPAPQPTSTPQSIQANQVPQPGAPSPRGLGDRFYPSLGNAGYDVQAYELDLKVEPLENDVQGKVRILSIATAALVIFHLDFAGMMVDRVFVNERVARFSRLDMELIITPAQPIPASETFETIVEWHGSPQPILDPAVHRPVGWIHDPQGRVLVASEPSGGLTWFPGNHHWSDKARYTLRLNLPSGWQAVSNGVPAQASEVDGRSLQTWEMHEPSSSYLVFLLIGHYEARSGTSPQGIPLLDFYPAGTGDRSAPRFARQGEILDFYSGLLGPYPFEVSGVAVVDQPLGFALETQTRSLFGNQAVAQHDEMVVAHELAHQWFGDSVTLRDWGDLWLKEGLATYLSALWVEHAAGPDVFRQTMQALYDDLVMGQFGLFFSPVASLRGDDIRLLYAAPAYTRAALMLHALRFELGEERFFAFLKKFYREHAGGLVTDEDFRTAAQAHSPHDLGDFFLQWMDAPGVPPRPDLPRQPWR